MKSTLIDLSQFIPESSVDYCQGLRHQHDFRLIITPPRRTRLGCFSVRPPQQPVIRINGNLNPYNFLITYLHEIAHCAVYKACKRSVLPHGKEWKQAFRNLLLPVLTPEVLPEDVLVCLTNYARDPKASTGGDRNLYEVLKRYDVPLETEKGKIPLMHVKEGGVFVFQSRLFIKGELRRTRVLCTEKMSSRRFTIPAHVLVEQPDFP